MRPMGRTGMIDRMEKGRGGREREEWTTKGLMDDEEERGGGGDGGW